jgi:hypothetical protein
MIEGLLDRALRAEPPSRAAHASESFNHGTPKAFTSQRNRVLQQLKSWRGRVTILFHLLNPYRWATASWRL